MWLAYGMIVIILENILEYLIVIRVIVCHIVALEVSVTFDPSESTRQINKAFQIEFEAVYFITRLNEYV